MRRASRVATIQVSAACLKQTPPGSSAGQRQKSQRRRSGIGEWNATSPRPPSAISPRPPPRICHIRLVRADTQHDSPSCAASSAPATTTPKGRALSKRVWLGVGELEGPDNVKSNKEFFAQFQASHYEGISLRVQVVPGERTPA
jgi:hypothetical protein